VKQSTEERQGVDKLHQIILEQRIPKETEKFIEFINRGGGNGFYRVFEKSDLAA